VVLCAFGLYESVDAAFGVFGTATRGGPLADLFDYPRWALAHFIPGALFMTIAPLQLWPAFRNRHRTLHRWLGRVMVAAGAFLGFSGASLVLLMPARPLAERIFMLTFFAVFLFFLFEAFMAARRRDFVRHRAWMIRMFCTGMTITTQRLLMIVFIVIARGVDSADQFWIYFVSAGWLAWIVQLSLAEWWIARGIRRPVRPSIGEPAGI
jgi:uncharacterized membrane protein